MMIYSSIPNPFYFHSPTHQTKIHLKSCAIANTKTKTKSSINKIEPQMKDNNTQKPLISNSPTQFCKCCRRHFIGGTLLHSSLPFPSLALDDPTLEILKKVHPPRSDWYEEFYASVLNNGMKEYEAEVGEALPLKDASVDAVVGTLVLCSVGDIHRTLQEVKRVLKPGGLYLFIEHVAAKEGTSLRFLQTILNPLQELVADGCHLTRETGKYISEAGFSNIDSNTTFISSFLFVNPHLYGMAKK